MHLTIEEWPPLSSVTGVTSFPLQRNVLSPPLHGTLQVHYYTESSNVLVL